VKKLPQFSWEPLGASAFRLVERGTGRILGYVKCEMDEWHAVTVIGSPLGRYVCASAAQAAVERYFTPRRWWDFGV